MIYNTAALVQVLNYLEKFSKPVILIKFYYTGTDDNVLV